MNENEEYFFYSISCCATSHTITFIDGNIETRCVLDAILNMKQKNTLLKNRRVERSKLFFIKYK